MSDNITIGRSYENDISIDQSYGNVSNKHATIEIQDGQLMLRDHSTNGTMINGRLIHHASVAIHNGDKILLATTYELSWNEILSRLPSLQRRTVRFDGSHQADGGGKITERFNQSGANTTKENPIALAHSNVTSQNGTVGQHNDYTQLELEEYLEKFNFGAFLSSWVWAVANRIFWPLLIIPISLIPYLGQVASLFLCTYLGIKGNTIAWNRSEGLFEKFISNQRKWTFIGIFLFISFSIIQFIAICFILS